MVVAFIGDIVGRPARKIIGRVSSQKIKKNDLNIRISNWEPNENAKSNGFLGPLPPRKKCPKGSLFSNNGKFG